MPLDNFIKKQIRSVAEAKKSKIILSNRAFYQNDIKELVDLLNHCPTILEVDLSRNSIGTRDAKELAQLQHVKKLILVSSDIDYAGALILCANENFRELTLGYQELGSNKESIIEALRKTERTTPLRILVTRGIDIKEFKDLDITIELGPRAEIVVTSNAEINVNIQNTDEENRKKNHSDESTASKSTAPMSVNSTTVFETPSNALSCCPLSFGWGSSNKQAPLSPSIPGAGK